MVLDDARVEAVIPTAGLGHARRCDEDVVGLPAHARQDPDLNVIGIHD